MHKIKHSTTPKEQIEILKKRGCIIENIDNCQEILSTVNYYRLSAYLLPFKNTNDTYSNGTSFQKIYNIYELDRKLRNFILEALETIDIAFRTRLSYFHSQKYGALGYLEASSFNNMHRHDRFLNNIAREKDRNCNVLYVKHHHDNYGDLLPLWVATELFTFGMTSYFYCDLKTSDQKIVAKSFNLNYKELRSWLRCLTDLRNICAHYGRLYFRKFTSKPAGLSMPENDKERLWALMIVLRNTYPFKDKWMEDVLPRFSHLVEQYNDHIDLYHLAFPKNWLDQLHL